MTDQNRMRKKRIAERPHTLVNDDYDRNSDMARTIVIAAVKQINHFSDRYRRV